jgi:NAD(P)H-quinone oxidoreductase subunit 4L
MSLQALLVVGAALFGIGVYGALSQQTFVMIMMGLELMLNGAMLSAVAFWATSTGGAPKGQLLAVIVMTVMAVEAAAGFALIIGIYRSRLSFSVMSALRMR